MSINFFRLYRFISTEFRAQQVISKQIGNCINRVAVPGEIAGAYDALAGFDLDPGYADINANFNQDICRTLCCLAWERKTWL